jgi:carbonic anhydrase
MKQTCEDCISNRAHTSSRREFLKVGILGAGAGLVTLAWPGIWAHAASKADALLLSCMDYRLIDETERYMSGRGLKEKYDQVILAGASLGALTDKYPAWNKTFWEHLDAAINLHGIHKVIVIDHRDCGAYRIVFGEDFAKDPSKETKVHTAKLQELKKQIKDKQPKLEVELFLMDLSGKVEPVS